MNVFALLIGVAENSERTMIQGIQVFRVGHSGNWVIIPLEETGLHGRSESGKDFVLADPIDVRGMRM